MTNGQTAAEDNDKVGILNAEITGALAHHAGPSAIERVIRSHQINCRPCGRDRDLQAADDFFKLLICAAEMDAGTEEENRPLRRSQPFGQFRALVRHEGVVRSRRIFGGVVAAQGRWINFDRLHIHWNVNPARAGPSADSQMPRTLQMVADGGGILDHHGVFGDVFDHCDDVHLLIAELPHGAGQSVRANKGLALDLAGYNDHRD